MKKNETELTIGVLAKKSGVGVETVKFYHRKGLLPKPTKPSGGGFRHYPEEDVTRIRFIKRAQELGFTLRETKDLLEINTRPSATCSDIKAKAKSKLSEVELKIQDLKRVKASLEELIHACGDGKKAAASCRVMNCFDLECEC